MQSLIDGDTTTFYRAGDKEAFNKMILKVQGFKGNLHSHILRSLAKHTKELDSKELQSKVYYWVARSDQGKTRIFLGFPKAKHMSIDQVKKATAILKESIDDITTSMQAPIAMFEGFQTFLTSLGVLTPSVVHPQTLSNLTPVTDAAMAATVDSLKVEQMNAALRWFSVEQLSSLTNSATDAVDKIASHVGLFLSYMEKAVFPFLQDISNGFTQFRDFLIKTIFGNVMNGTEEMGPFTQVLTSILRPFYNMTAETAMDITEKSLMLLAVVALFFLIYKMVAKLIHIGSKVVQKMVTGVLNLITALKPGTMSMINAFLRGVKKITVPVLFVLTGFVLLEVTGGLLTGCSTTPVLVTTFIQSMSSALADTFHLPLYIIKYALATMAPSSVPGVALGSQTLINPITMVTLAIKILAASLIARGVLETGQNIKKTLDKVSEKVSTAFLYLREQFGREDQFAAEQNEWENPDMSTISTTIIDKYKVVPIAKLVGGVILANAVVNLPGVVLMSPVSYSLVSIMAVGYSTVNVIPMLVAALATYIIPIGVGLLATYLVVKNRASITESVTKGVYKAIEKLCEAKQWISSRVFLKQDDDELHPVEALEWQPVDPMDVVEDEMLRQPEEENTGSRRTPKRLHLHHHAEGLVVQELARFLNDGTVDPRVTNENMFIPSATPNDVEVIEVATNRNVRRMQEEAATWMNRSNNARRPAMPGTESWSSLNPMIEQNQRKKRARDHEDHEHEHKDKKKRFKGCVECGADARFLCGGCTSVHYCSQACQISHWTEHEAECT